MLVKTVVSRLLTWHYCSRQLASSLRCHMTVDTFAKTVARRNIHLSCFQYHNTSSSSNKNLIQVNYVTKNGEKITIYGAGGMNVMSLAQQNNIDIEGACEASLACCTCHVYVRDDYYDRLPTATEEEEDLLDMAPFLKSNSRLSCQIILSKDIDGIEVTLPPATRNFYVDDKKPSHH